MEQNLQGIADAIVRLAPDVVALQEVDRQSFRSHYIDQLTFLVEKTGLPHAAWVSIWDARWVPFPGLDPRQHIGRVRSGLVVLSRYPLSDHHRFPLPQPRHHTRLRNRFSHHRALQRVLVHGPFPFTVLNIHLEAYDVATRHEQAEIVLLHATAAAQELPTVLIGDLNALPASAAQKHGFADEPAADVRHDRTWSMVIAAGLRDALAGHEAARDAPALTFPAQRPNRRLDHVFTSEHLRATDARVVTDIAHSDHLPILVEIAGD
jgi:endonuclease/exonuclease/phosphatase family metal-dependent hydrolase